VRLILGAEFVTVDRESRPLPITLMDAAVWRIRLPAALDAATRSQLLREWVEHFYEHVWIRQPRRSLGTAQNAALSPADSASGPARTDVALQARLEGLVTFREQLALRPSMQHLYQGYPFDRLRRRLGLEPRDPSLIEAADLSCMSPEEVGTLDLTQLDRTMLAEVYQIASPGPARDRLVLRLFQEDPRLVPTFDFPRFGLRALQLAGDRSAAVLEEIRRSAGVNSEDAARLELLERLDHLLREAPIHPALSPRDERLLADPASLQRLCRVLEEAGLRETTSTLEAEGLRFALEQSRPWPVPDL
jgi:hypothetical protein